MTSARKPAARSLIALVLAALGLGCPATPTLDSGPAANGQTTDASPEPPARSDAPEFVLAPEAGEVAELVAAELERSEAEGRMLLVYVGASWCEPCQYFHAAAEDGTLDQTLAGVRLLEFDLDQDRDRLVAAGYHSNMIPLFVAPAPGGRAGPRRMEGGIKGPAAVENLQKRLEALLRAARADQASRLGLSSPG